LSNLALPKLSKTVLFNVKYSHYSDKELIQLYAEKGDKALIGILYERYGHLVLGLCLKYLKNKPDAQDAVVNIFTKLLDDLKKYNIEFFKSWLYVYSKNHCLMALRKRQRLLKKELDLQENVHLIVDFEALDHLKEKEAQINMLEDALELLNEGQKLCVELFYIKSKSYQQIVEITGYSANDVKSFIQNGKRNLKIKMETLMHEQRKKQ